MDTKYTAKFSFFDKKKENLDIFYPKQIIKDKKNIKKIRKIHNSATTINPQPNI